MSAIHFEVDPLLITMRKEYDRAEVFLFHCIAVELYRGLRPLKNES